MSRQPFSQVYHLIKLTPEGVPSFWNAIKQATPYKGALTDEVNVFVWKFVDGHELVVKQEEHRCVGHTLSAPCIADGHVQCPRSLCHVLGDRVQA